MKRADLIKRIDKLFQFCRRYDGAFKKNGEWYNTCVTSGQVLPMSKIQAGHWIPRAVYATRWNPKNCNPQSAHDNLYKNGAYIEYSHWFIKKYGMKEYEKMLDIYERHKQGKIPAFKMNELQQIYDYWLKESRELEKKIGEKKFPASWDFFGEDYLDYNPTNN